MIIKNEARFFSVLAHHKCWLCLKSFPSLDAQRSHVQAGHCSVQGDDPLQGDGRSGPEDRVFKALSGLLLSSSPSELTRENLQAADLDHRVQDRDGRADSCSSLRVHRSDSHQSHDVEEEEEEDSPAVDVEHVQGEEAGLNLKTAALILAATNPGYPGLSSAWKQLAIISYLVNQ